MKIKDHFIASSLVIFLFIYTFASCRKNTSSNETDSDTWHRVSSLTKIYIVKADSQQNRIGNNEKTEIPTSASVQTYDITTGCSSTTLDLTQINVYYRPGIKPSSYYIKINGVTFYPTYTGMAFYAYYQLTGISLSAIGISDFCTADSITVEHYVNNVYTNTEKLSVNDGVSCGNGSYQCSAFSPGSGQLSFYLPYLSCSCRNAYPSTYTFWYRLQGTTTWTTIPVSYPTYFSNYTVSGLPAGTYEVDGQNTCTYFAGPAVPALPSTVTVP